MTGERSGSRFLHVRRDPIGAASGIGWAENGAAHVALSEQLTTAQKFKFSRQKELQQSRESWRKAAAAHARDVWLVFLTRTMVFLQG